jgi:phage terminase large subunit-like protein
VDTQGNHTDPRVAVFINAAIHGTGEVCRLTRLAVERHVHDLERSESDSSYPFYFDADAARVALDFCKLVHHYKGEWVGQVFDPRPDQAFLLWCVFGWKRREDGRRRFREVLYEVAKKNGKTFLGAVVALLLLLLDGEAGAEIYSTAAKRDQAALAWKDAAAIVRASPALAKRIQLPRGRFAYNMFVAKTGSKYQALSAEDQGSDGVMPSGVINDELHRQVGRDLYDVLKYGSRSRRQPLFLHATTAGDELETSLYDEIHSYATDVLEGVVEGAAADEFFALVFTLDEGDDWKNKEVWIKANPGLGVNLRHEDLEKDFREAIDKPAAEASFKRLRLNVRTSTSAPWIRGEDWDACFDRELVGWEGWQGNVAYGGLDLGSTTDTCSFATLLPRGDVIGIRCMSWCPGDLLEQRADRDRAGYVEWARQGWLKPTPGNVADYRWIEQTLVEWSKLYAYREIGYDRAKAVDVVVRMADAGVPLVEVGQGPVNMTAPIQRFEDLVISRAIRHDGNPLLKWYILNAKCYEVSSGSTTLKKLKKANYRARIDGVSASLNATRLYLDLNPGQEDSGYGEDYYAEPPTASEPPAEEADARPSASGYGDYFKESEP